MATGITSLAQITNALEVFIDETQYIADAIGIVERLVQTKRLPRGKGLTWHEPLFGTLTAGDLVDGEIFDDPTLISDSGFQITPTEKGVQVLWSDRLVLAMRDNFPQIASEMMAGAIEYRRDQDLVTIGQSAGGVLGNGTVPVTSGIISAALRSVQTGIPLSGATARPGARSTGEPSKGPWACIIHPFNGHDLYGQWTATAGTSALTGAVTSTFSRAADVTDYTTRWLEQNEGGSIPGLPGAKVYYDQNIPIVAGVAKGFLLDKNSIVHLTYQDLQDYKFRTQDGRNTLLTLWADYAVGERADAHIVVLNVDATAPTS